MLVWALGPNTDGNDFMGGGGGLYPVDSRSSRVVDPTVFSETTAAHNMSLSTTEFIALWSVVQQARTPNTTSAEYAKWCAPPEHRLLLPVCCVLLTFLAE